MSSTGRDVPKVLEDTRLAPCSVHGPVSVPCSVQDLPHAVCPHSQDHLDWDHQLGLGCAVSEVRGVSTSPALKWAASSFKKSFLNTCTNFAWISPKPLTFPLK